MRHYLLLATFCLSTFLIGQDVLTRGEVYDYDVGDEFQYSYDNFYGTMVDRFVVLDKEVSQNGDTLHYKMFKSKYIYDEDGDTFIEDTISKTYTNLNAPITTFGDSTYIYDQYQDSSYYYYPDTIIEYKTNLCDLEVNGWYAYPPIFESNQIIRIYGRGVGLVRKYHYDPSSAGITELENYNLYYYKKGSTSCGSKVTASLSTEIALDDLITVAPNPTNEHLNIEISESLKVKEMRLYNPQGQRVGADIIGQGNSYCLNARKLKSGIYTLILQSNNGVVSKKVSVIH